MTDKTKRQLRTEAVERLKEPRYETLSDYVYSMLGWGHEPHRAKEAKAGLIDLLTDDEPPEGDPVRIMREASGSDVSNLLLINTTCSYVVEEAYSKLADMVERDYVRREDYVATGKSLGLAQAERDYWKQQVQACLDAAYPPNGSASYVPEVMAYPDRDGCTTPATLVCATIDGLRDEWKTEHDGVKRSNDGVTRGVTNLEWLYENDEQFAAYVRISEAVIKRLAPSYAHEWLMAEHLDEMREHSLEPESYTLESESHTLESESGSFSFGTAEAGAPQVPESDTREKLEADIENFKWFHDEDRLGHIRLVDAARCWLDRQAAITERECSDAFREYRTRKLGITGLADLQAELKRERAQREHWQRVAGKHAAEMQRMREQLDAQLPEGVEWPRFEDGELVRFGDEFRWNDEIHTVDEFRFQRGFTGVCGQAHCSESPIKRPPLIAADGKPIEAGQVLYGEDGTAWTVDRIEKLAKES